MSSGGKLILVATPIGNLGDLSLRASRALTDSDFWIVEDTRVSGKLQSHLGIKKPMVVCNEHTRNASIRSYVDRIEAGETACLLTDGGTPVVSDPGTFVVEACIEGDISVEIVPGPSAPIAALALSGFFGQRFAFLGFLPRKPGPIKAELQRFADSPLTLILFESPHRIQVLLEAAHAVLGQRRYVVCREMTKAHEQVFRSKLPTIPTEQQMPRKGEVTVVIEGLRREAT